MKFCCMLSLDFVVGGDDVDKKWPVLSMNDEYMLLAYIECWQIWIFKGGWVSHLLTGAVISGPSKQKSNVGGL